MSSPYFMQNGAANFGPAPGLAGIFQQREADKAAADRQGMQMLGNMVQYYAGQSAASQAAAKAATANRAGSAINGASAGGGVAGASASGSGPDMANVMQGVQMGAQISAQNSKGAGPVAVPISNQGYSTDYSAVQNKMQTDNNQGTSY